MQRMHVDVLRILLEQIALSRQQGHHRNLLVSATGTGKTVMAGMCVEEALDRAEIVCTCTSAREPIVRLAWLGPGAHLNVVGSSIATARELDADVVAASALFVDRRESTLNEGGDYLMAVEEAGIGPDHIRAELGELLVGSRPGRSDETELTVFKSLGLAVEDLAAAALCVERARERGVGTEVAF